MKTKATLAISILVVCLLPFQSFAQNAEKIYQVTEEGQYQFIYVKDYLQGNGIIHPITPRTFYLETKRLGLIPGNVSYTSFLQYENASVQAMVDVSQSEIIARLASSTSNNDVVRTNAHPLPAEFALLQQGECGETFCNAKPEMKPEEMQVEEQPVEEQSTEEQPTQPRAGLSWIAKAVMHPGSEAVRVKPKEAGKDTTYTQVRTKIPWIVQMMLMEGEMPYEQWYDPNNIPPLTESEAKRRVRLHDLVQDLLNYQDDEIQEVYGKVFPGLDGKLYGGSDQELDELVQTLLNMKNEFLATCEPELNEIFSELEMLAMSR